MGFGLHLKEILRERGMTIKQLSEDSGISVNTLYSITKRDSLRVDPVILKKIAQTLGLSVTELIGSTNSSGETDIGLVALGISELLDIDDREAVFEAVIEASLHSPKISFNIANYLNTEQTNKGKVINEISKLLDFLNEDGQLEAVKRIEELTEISKYQHIDPPMDEEK